MIIDIEKMRKCSYLLPDPGGEVVREVLDEIERLQADCRSLGMQMMASEDDNYQLRTVMAAVASAPGRDWLSGQLALTEALQGGGPHVDEIMKQAAEAAGGE